MASHHIFGIAAASETLFSPLYKTKNGMKIYITDKQNIYVYVITAVETVEPERVDVIDDYPDRNQITLVTCEDAEATMRTIVFGDLETSLPFEGAPQDILKHFERSYNQVQL